MEHYKGVLTSPPRWVRPLEISCMVLMLIFCVGMCAIVETDAQKIHAMQMVIDKQNYQIGEDMALEQGLIDAGHTAQSMLVECQTDLEGDLAYLKHVNRLITTIGPGDCSSVGSGACK